MKFCLSLFVAVLALLAIAACSTVSKEQCVASDWVALGKADAATGHPLSRFENIAKDCGKHGITADPQAYQNGWNQGVQIYCEPQNGFNQGR